MIRLSRNTLLAVAVMAGVTAAVLVTAAFCAWVQLTGWSVLG